MIARRGNLSSFLLQQSWRLGLLGDLGGSYAFALILGLSRRTASFRLGLIVDVAGIASQRGDGVGFLAFLSIARIIQNEPQRH